MEEQTELAASIIIENKNNVWVKDHTVTHCHNCNLEFGFWCRKHHCRNCGNIFCNKCSNNFIVIPEFMTDRPTAADFWNISYYVTSLKKKEERVCKKCSDLIIEKSKAYDRIVNIFKNPESIDSIAKLSELDLDIKTHYIDHLRNIQYYLPNHQYTEIDKKLLNINAIHFSKHSKYIVHLIKSIDWKSKIITYSHEFQNNSIKSQEPIECDPLDFIIKILNGERNKSCMDIFCTRTCAEYLSCDDCVNILYSCYNDLPDKLMQFLFDIIMLTPEQIILCHVSFFVNLVKNNNGSSKVLEELIYKLLSQTKKLMYHTFWFINNAKEKSDNKQLVNICSFIEKFDKEHIKTMTKEYLFFAGLIANLSDAKRYLLTHLEKYKPISLPYEPDIQIIGADTENIIIKDSYTKPVIITFYTVQQESIKLLFKKESVMNDVAVLSLMTICDTLLNDHIDKNFDVITYPTMPLTAHSGMIEIINEAETLQTIRTKKKPILKHIMLRNENKIIGQVLDRYMYSLISYTLHSYFIGLGDRHPGNIMITDDGAIFHIDFGYILGKDTYPLTGSEIKLNSDMLDVITNDEIKIDRSKIYLEMCAKGVILLRKYFNLFFILLSQDTNYDNNHIEKFIMSRFQPRQNDNMIVNSLMVIIKKSNNAYSSIIRDLFYDANTNAKTVRNDIGVVLRNAVDTIKKVVTGDINN